MAREKAEIVFKSVLENLRECDEELKENGLEPHYEKEFWEGLPS